MFRPLAWFLAAADDTGNGDGLVVDILRLPRGHRIHQFPVLALLQLCIRGTQRCDILLGERDTEGRKALTLAGVKGILTAVRSRRTVNLIGNLCTAVGKFNGALTQNIGGILLVGGNSRFAGAGSRQHP